MGSRTKYDSYLRSNAWQRVRARAFATYGRKCARCPSTKKLHVHHKTYVRMGSELMEDLEILCESCHTIEHGLKTAPTISGKPRRRKARNLQKKQHRPLPTKKRKPSKQKIMLSAANDALHELQLEIKQHQQRASELRS